MRLHAIVTDFEAAVRAVEGGATVIQLRLKGASTGDVIQTGRAFLDLPATFVVNDDVEAALALGADGVHLGRDDPGAERALEQGLMLGISASTVDEALAGEQLGAAYIGAGPVWATPSKPDADSPIGLDGLRRSARRSRFPSSQSEASTRRTQRTASRRALQGWPSCARLPTRERSVRLSQVGELGLLAELERRGLAQRIENDAAQLGDGLVVTQDALVEGVHFRFDLVSWRDLGFRAAAVNLSDLAASGADPEALVVTLGASDGDRGRRRGRALRRAERARRPDRRRRHDPLRARDAERDRAWPLGSRPGPRGSRARRRPRRHRTARRRGRRVQERPACASAAPSGRGEGAGRGRPRAARYLGRSRGRCGSHRRALRCPVRDRPRARAAGRRIRVGRPRIRRGLRVAGRRGRAGTLHRHRAL